MVTLKSGQAFDDSRYVDPGLVGIIPAKRVRHEDQF